MTNNKEKPQKSLRCIITEGFVQFSKVALVTNFNIPEKAEAARSVARAFAAHGAAILLDLSARGKCGIEATGITPRYMAAHTLYENAEIVAVVGGDGSVLEAARRSASRGIPVLGINKGRLGFLCDLEIDELSLIDRLYVGSYNIEKHSMLNVEVLGRADGAERKRVYIARALNDAVVSNGSVARIVDIELRENGKTVASYRADGLIASTPTGSTAYSLSAGGPVLDPRLGGICITPICAHSVCSKPIVFPDSARLEIVNICQREPALFLTVDGRVNVKLSRGDSVRVTRSDKSAGIVRLKEDSFYSMFCRKMSGI